MEDDPQQRRPDIRRAAELIGFHPRVRMIDGLRTTIEYFRNELAHERLADRQQPINKA